MADLKELWPGWKTVRLIGRGSFGSVYEIERDVYGHIEKDALKLITIPQNGSDIEELYDSGYDEASVTATFKSHLESIVNEYSLMREMNGAPNIVKCDDFRVVPHDDNIGYDIFIKMELLTSLTKALVKQPSEEQVIRIAKDICTALILCKKYDIIHRDIKPQNIFVSKNGDYKLGDFGIAKTMEKTTGGTKIGTYKYMAPEVYNNKPYNLTADIYSLGLVLHWLLNERRSPFMPLPPEPVIASREEEARLQRFKGVPIPPPVHGSEELKRIVLKACAYDPKDRYQSADEMLQDLRILSGEISPEPYKPAAVEENVPPVEEPVPLTNGTGKEPEPVIPDPVLDDSSVEDLTEGEKTIGSFNTVRKEEKKKTGKPWIWAVAAAVVILGVVVFFLFTGRVDRMLAESKAEKDNYAGALASYEKYLSRSGDTSAEAYAQACVYALGAGDAKKAMEYVDMLPANNSESDQLLEEAVVLLAKQKMDNKEWKEALSILKGFDTVETRKLADESRFHIAQEAAKKKNYDEAIPHLRDNTYSGAKALLDDCIYNKAVALMEDGKLNEAINYINDTPSAKTDELLDECCERYAKSLMNQKNWSEALTFLKSNVFSGRDDLLSECRYQRASELMDGSKWAEAVTFMVQESDPVTDSLLNEARYRYGVELMKSEKWDDAVTQFQNSTYKDSTDLLKQCKFNNSPDSRFLTDIVTFCNSLKSSDTNSSQVSSLVKTLETYNSQAFQDSSLQKAARAFISDMQIFRDSLSSNSKECKKQQTKCDAYADAVEQLNQINKLYPFASDVWKSMSSYWRTASYWKTLASIVKQLDSDMDSKSKSGYNKPTEQFVRIPNNTGHALTVTFWFRSYDPNGILVTTDEVKTSLPKGVKTTVYFEFDLSKAIHWGYDFRIDSYS